MFRVDNNPCRGVLAAPTVGLNTADSCGILRYTLPTDTVTMGFIAIHPNNFADFSFGLIRGHVRARSRSAEIATSSITIAKGKTSNGDSPRARESIVQLRLN
jgi:hypothetical protein